MAALVCEICGGKLIGKPGGIFECDSCGMEYSTEWAKAKIQEIKGTVKVEGTVEVQGTVKVEGPVKVEGAANANSLLRRGQMAMEDKKFEEAKNYFNQVLDIDPECGMAYWGLALVAKRGKIEALAEACFDEGESSNIKRARKYADQETLEKLEKLDTLIAEIPRIREEKEAQEKAQKEALKEQRIKDFQQRKKLVTDLRKRLSAAKGRLAIGAYHTVGLKPDGSVLAVGDNRIYQCAVQKWSNIVAVAAGDYHTVGLKADGTVVSMGSNQHGQCNVRSWRNIVAIDAAESYTVGLKSNGTVVYTGWNVWGFSECTKWSNIVAISAYGNRLVALKSDGTVVEDGLREHSKDFHWGKNIVDVAAGSDCTYALTDDGSVLKVKYSRIDRSHEAKGERGYMAIKAGYGTALISFGGGISIDGSRNYFFGKGYVDVCVGFRHGVALKADGSVEAHGDNSYGQCNVNGWKLLDNNPMERPTETSAVEEAATQYPEKQEDISAEEPITEELITEEDMLRLIQAAEAENEKKTQARIAQLTSEKLAIEKELPTLKGLFSGSRRKEIETRLAEIEKELKTLE